MVETVGFVIDVCVLVYIVLIISGTSRVLFCSLWFSSACSLNLCCPLCGFVCVYVKWCFIMHLFLVVIVLGYVVFCGVSDCCNDLPLCVSVGLFVIGLLSWLFV